MADLLEALVASLIAGITGGFVVEYQGKSLDFTPPWRRVSLADALGSQISVEGNLYLTELPLLRTLATTYQVRLCNENDWGLCLEDIFQEVAEGRIVQPAFVTHHPRTSSPFAQVHTTDSRFAQRAELVVAGIELAHGATEVTDYDEQISRLQEFSPDGHQRPASDYLPEGLAQALREGMPATGGMGLGLDRLLMLLCDAASIAEVQAFPLK